MPLKHEESHNRFLIDARKQREPVRDVCGRERGGKGVSKRGRKGVGGKEREYEIVSGHSRVHGRKEGGKVRRNVDKRVEV
jgi:hypothetical protein